ncbi:hypothetical protein BB561_000460 [Smittium simulii]|uniref:C2H2-type domain-containing protein n=1 Tax=Smittium simulii TaxID=133385 RepID=A0A2T9YZ83_9FUNG|nr:hypothetical protein BB561_000460 [Smittium simulii]
MNYQGKYSSNSQPLYNWNPPNISHAEAQPHLETSAPQNGQSFPAQLTPTSAFSCFKSELPQQDSFLTNNVKRGRPKENRIFTSSKLKSTPYSSNSFQDLELKKAIFQKIQKQSEFVQGKIDETGRREYQCSVSNCKKIFYQRAHLNIHLRSHVGYKPFICQYPGCNKSFTQQGNLRTHERKHTGEKPYKCKFSGCSKSFTQAGNLKTHIRKIHQIDDNSLSLGGSSTTHNGSPTDSNQTYLNSFSMVSQNSIHSYDASNTLVNDISNHRNINTYPLSHNLSLNADLNSSIDMKPDNYGTNNSKLGIGYNLTSSLDLNYSQKNGYSYENDQHTHLPNQTIMNDEPRNKLQVLSNTKQSHYRLFKT